MVQLIQKSIASYKPSNQDEDDEEDSEKEDVFHNELILEEISKIESLLNDIYEGERKGGWDGIGFIPIKLSPMAKGMDSNGINFQLKDISDIASTSLLISVSTED